jgi:hypothetical protein
VIREAAGLALVNVTLAGLGAGMLLVFGAWRRLALLSFAALSPLTGVAAYLALMPPLLYAGISPTPVVLALLAALALVGGLLLERRRGRPGERLASGRGWLPALILVAPMGLLLWHASIKQAVEIDWQLDWALKARLLAGHGGLLTGALDDRFFSGLYSNSHREYPLGLPALQAVDYHAMGQPDTAFVHVQYALILIAFIAAMWVLLRPHVSAPVLTVGLSAVAVSPAVQVHTLYDPWDMMVAALWVAGAVAACIWLGGGGRVMLALSAVFLAGALGAKVEAEANTAVLFILVIVYLLWRRRFGDLRDGAVAAAAVIATAVPWQVFSRVHDLHSQIVQPSAGRMIDQAGDVPTIVRSVTRALLDGSWLAAVPLTLACAVVMLIRRRDSLLAVAFLAACVSLTAALVAVYWNHSVPLHHILVTSVSRTVCTIVLLAAVALPVLAERALGDLTVPWRRSAASGSAASGATS